MVENRGAAAASGEQASKIKSEKSKDIRATNIIAAKGKSAYKAQRAAIHSLIRLPEHVHLIAV
mgnify:CR=1 FL=1